MKQRSFWSVKYCSLLCVFKLFEWTAECICVSMSVNDVICLCIVENNNNTF